MTSELIAVVGESGTGKTRSVKGLNPNETFFITISGKKPSFIGWKTMYTPFDMHTKKGNFFHAMSYDVLIPNSITKSRGLLRMIAEDMKHIKNIVIDDFQYLMSFEFMERAYEKGWDKFTEIARHAFDTIKTSQYLGPYMKVFFLCHEENAKGVLGTIRRKIKTIGNLLDDKITLEGLFTFVFFTAVIKEIGKETPTFYFETQSDGTTTAKSVEGVFDKFRIENDLGLVVQAIDKYNNG
jgi:hypothetical protein